MEHFSKFLIKLLEAAMWILFLVTYIAGIIVTPAGQASKNAALFFPYAWYQLGLKIMTHYHILGL